MMGGRLHVKSSLTKVDYPNYGHESGGFLNDGQRGARSSQDSPGGRKGGPRNHSLRPVTLLQLHNAESRIPDQPMQIDGHDVEMISVVGRIQKIDTQSTSTSFLIDDGTASPMEFKQWVSNEGNSTPSPYSEGDYVRIIGGLRNFANRKQLVAQHMRKITNMNELTLHLTEALYVSLYHRKGPLGKPGVPAFIGGGGVDVQFNNFGTNSFGFNSRQAAADSTTNMSNMDPLQARIMKIIMRGNDSTEGTNIFTIVNALRSEASEDAIRQALEVLGTEGLVYGTIDDDHFKASAGN